MSEDAAVGPPEQLHPFYLLTGLGAGLRSLGGAYALIAYLAVTGRLQSALIGALGLLMLAGVSLFLYWRRFEFRVGANEIRIDKGIVRRTHRSIPFDRVQDVDITQGPVARLLGLAKVTFETGGGSAMPGAEEGVLEAITLERAQQLRELVRARRAKAAAPPVEAEAEAEPVYAMTTGRLLLAGMFNFSLALFAGLIGLTQTLGDFMGFDPFSRGFWDRLLSAGDPLRDYVLANRTAAVLAGAVLLVLVGILTGIVRTVLRDYGFRLERSGAGLRRRRGLLTRSDVTLPVRRAQAVIVATGPVRDRFGWRELKLRSLARDEGGGGDHVLAPLANDEEVSRILAALGWRPVAQDVGWQRVSRAFIWSFLAGLAPLLAPLAAAQLIFAPSLGLVWLTVPAALFLARYLEWKRTGYALDGDRLLVRSGWWQRRKTILPLAKIQSVDLRESVVTRLFGTASLHFGVAGASAVAGHSIPAIPRGRARELRDRLLGFGP